MQKQVTSPETKRGTKVKQRVLFHQKRHGVDKGEEGWGKGEEGREGRRGKRRRGERRREGGGESRVPTGKLQPKHDPKNRVNWVCL